MFLYKKELKPSFFIPSIGAPSTINIDTPLIAGNSSVKVGVFLCN